MKEHSPKTHKKHKRSFWTTLVASAVISSLYPAYTQAQQQPAEQSTNNEDEAYTEVISVVGIRQALSSALLEKRSQDNLVEIINAEDVGKLPDENLAEVLENVTGVQITRNNGVGSSVQIRGASENRIEINGVGTVPAGDSRTGISFEDVPAAIIASLEVTKVPTAKHIEGAVGGTINLRTRKGLDLQEPLISFRLQEQYSDLSESWSPTFSSTLGNAWSTSAGKIGGVLSVNWNRTDVAQFQPRFDRDRVVLSQSSIDALTDLDNQGFAVPNFPNALRASAEDFDFLRVQFLQQGINNLDSERLNLTGSIEYAPVDNLKFFIEGTYNENERTILRNEVQFSGTGGNAPVDNTTNTSFETVDLGSINGPNGPLDLGQIQAVETGIIGVGVGGNIDPNFRTVSSANSRFTDNTVISGGVNWSGDRITVDVRGSYSISDSETPINSIVLDFINPNGPQPSTSTSADNGTPAAFDTRNGRLTFGPAFGAEFAPTVEEFLSPQNYELRSVGLRQDENENEDKEFRVDIEYVTSELIPVIDSIDFGMRWNEQSSENNDSNRNTNYTARAFANQRLNAAEFAELLNPGFDNFDQADGRELFVRDYLVLNTETLLNDTDSVINTLTQLIEASNANGTDLPSPIVPTFNQGAFFDIKEETIAAYLQANLYTEILDMPLRGNIGVRYIDTEVTTNGFNQFQGEFMPVSETADYDYFLPRASLVLEPVEDLLIRAGFARDIRRPNFGFLSPAINFPANPGSRINTGNPALQPQEIDSFDISAEYYISESAFVSVGFFHKERTNLFGSIFSNAVELPGADGQIERDITAPCEEGGIFNPFAMRGVFSSVDGEGICVDFGTRTNQPGETSNTGVEIAFQYDLAGFEEQLGWASGFGLIFNLTVQRSNQDGGELGDDGLFLEGNGDANALNLLLGRVDDPANPITATTADDLIFQERTLQSLSENSYNITLFYEKYGLSARARYTWRSEFFTSEFQSFNLPRIVDSRAQLNANISYDITDQLQFSVEGINLLREDRAEFCVNSGALLCDQGLSDRRLTFGIRYTY